jgi:predicted amidohydrolase
VRVAIVQADCALGDVEANVARAGEAARAAAAGGADLIVFPELNLTGYSLGLVDADVGLEAQDERLAAIAAAAGDAAVVVGFLESPKGVQTYNAAAYFEAGELRHVHRKLYLPTYGVFEERKHFSPGASLRAFPTRFGRAAVLICNDAWQPVLAFLAVQDGAQVLIVPSASSSGAPMLHTKGYWSEITRFYGRIFQAYVVFANRVGEEGDLRFWGGSHVVDPWGELVAAGPEEREATVYADLDLAAVRRRRREVPLVREARLALVGREVERLIAEGGDI